MKEVKRTPNSNKLFNRVLECENELKQLYNSGFKLINLKGIDQYFRIRSKLRCTYERLLIEESEFSLVNGFEDKLWEECYEKPINWIQRHLEAVTTTTGTGAAKNVNTIHLRRLRSVLINIIDEGSTFFQLLLGSDKILTNFRYKILIFSSILIRKREKFLLNKCFRAFNLLQDAITFEPFKGFGYLVLAQWTLEDGDELLSIYWALISFNVKEKEEKSLEFLKNLSINFATSPSFLNFNCKDDDVVIGQLFQMSTHALLSKLTGTSHLKHLDQLSHSQLKNLDKVDLKSLKYSIKSLWMILGMIKGDKELGEELEGEGREGGQIQSSVRNSVQATVDHAQDRIPCVQARNSCVQDRISCLQVSQVQTCILAKLFQVHAAFINNPAITQIFLAFASNEKYSNFFTGNNYRILMKINVYSFETLNNLLKKLLEVDTTLNEHVYLDYLVLETFNVVDKTDLIEYFIEKGLYHRQDNEIQLISSYEKAKTTERSMKLLTHRFLSSQLESMEAKIEPIHLPWTIPDYFTLLKQFQRIRKQILLREIRILITLPLLQELDLDKSQKDIRDIIRFLHDRIDSNDPYIKLEAGDQTDFNQNFKISHLKSVKLFVNNNEDVNVKIICSDSFSKDYLIRGNIDEDLIYNEI